MVFKGKNCRSFGMDNELANAEISNRIYTTWPAGDA